MGSIGESPSGLQPSTREHNRHGGCATLRALSTISTAGAHEDDDAFLPTATLAPQTRSAPNCSATKQTYHLRGIFLNPKFRACLLQ
jgi:hypothetical protein